MNTYFFRLSSTIMSYYKLKTEKILAGETIELKDEMKPIKKKIVFGSYLSENMIIHCSPKINNELNNLNQCIKRRVKKETFFTRDGDMFWVQFDKQQKYIPDLFYLMVHFKMKTHFSKRINLQICVDKIVML